MEYLNFKEDDLILSGLSMGHLAHYALKYCTIKLREACDYW
ncbi:hypothetical protein [Staphylococcus epidermidis]